MQIFKVAIIAVGIIIVAFIVASVALFGEHAFLLWVGLIALVVYGIVGLVTARRSR